MPLGSSIFLVAAGAILRYAVTAHISGVSRPTLGLILMLVGAAGILLSLLFMASASRRAVGRERVVTRDPYEEAR